MIYFITYGYGYSIAGIGLFLLLSQNGLTIEEIILGILYITYGLRLSLFLLIRNKKSPSYIEKVKHSTKNTEDIKFFTRIMIWLSTSLLYACQTSPLVYRTISNKKEKENKILLYISIIISIIGLIIEGLADNQKSEAKKINPKRFVDTGLYKIVRCPNFFGEIIFWTGNFISGFNIYIGLLQWFITSLGYIGIVYIMLGSTRRIEISQNKNYGNDAEYKKYVKKTPILIPFVPIYSIEKYTYLSS